MKSARIAGLSLSVLLASPIFAAAQTAPGQPDALDLLKNVELTYRAMETYSAKSTMVSEMNSPNMQQKTEMPSTITADSSGKMRLETVGAMGMLMVFDGETFWMYMRPLNKYAKFSLASLASAAQSSGTGMVTMGGVGGNNPIAAYTNVATNVKDAKILRSEKLHFGGSDVDCWVVAAESQPVPRDATAAESTNLPLVDLSGTKTLWVDKTRYLVYREDSSSKMTMPGSDAFSDTKQSIKFESIAVDQPVPPEAFTFAPPEGATEMDLSSFMPKTPATK